jgi:hypothetical protein
MMTTLDSTKICAQCGATLAAGAVVRGPYRNGAVYGTACHRSPRKRPARGREPLGQRYSRYDRYGVYAHDGTRIGRISCGCEDYPCCGH